MTVSLLSAHNPERSLRSSNQRLLNVPRAKLKSRGDRAFAVAAPKLFDFTAKVKTHVFSLVFNCS